MFRIYRLVVAWCVAILGGFFSVAGGVLASLGGSFYYLVAGIAMVLSGALLGRRPRYGRRLFVAIWVGTLIWATWEVGFDGLQLVPRLVAPTVLLVLVLLTGWSGRSLRSPAHAVPAAVVVLLALGVCGVAINGGGVEVQEAASAATIRSAPTGEADGDWRDYGGTLAGRRYSALADITPQNVGRLQLAWTQRTGDLPMEAETINNAIVAVRPAGFPANTSQRRNLGSADYYGGEIGIVARVGPTLDVRANYTHIERDFAISRQTGVVIPAFELTDVPSDKGFVYASWRPFRRLELTPSVEFASNRTTVTTASPPVYYRTGSYVRADIRADFALTEQLSIGIGARNLFDEYYTLTDGFPEAGRSFFAVVRAKY